jgi:hypothetical protein
MPTSHRTTLPLMVGFFIGLPAAVSGSVAVLAGLDVLVDVVVFVVVQLTTEGNGGVPGIDT